MRLLRSYSPSHFWPSACTTKISGRPTKARFSGCCRRTGRHADAPRQMDADRRPYAFMTLYGDVAAVLFHDRPHARQSQSRAARLRQGVSAAVEALEQPRQIASGDADAFVRDAEHCPLAAGIILAAQ